MCLVEIHNKTHQKSCGLSSIKSKLTILYEDNAACIAQVKGGYIKGYRTKHISPKLFYTHELHNSGEINVQLIRATVGVPESTIFINLNSSYFRSKTNAV